MFCDLAAATEAPESRHSSGKRLGFFPTTDGTNRHRKAAGCPVSKENRAKAIRAGERALIFVKGPPVLPLLPLFWLGDSVPLLK